MMRRVTSPSETSAQTSAQTPPEEARDTAPGRAPAPSPAPAAPDAAEAAPWTAAETAPATLPDAEPEDAPDTPPARALGTTPEEAPAAAPEEAPAAAPEETPAAEPEGAPAAEPEGAPDAAPRATPPAGPGPSPDPADRSGDAPPAPSPAPHPTRGRLLALLAGLAGLVAVVCALTLPFAPVSVNEPTVSWPRDPARPEPTLLPLTAYRPLALDVTFTCAAARQAGAADGVVLSTVNPEWPLAGRQGLLVTAREGRVQVRALDELVLDEPLAGDCTYTIAGTSRGRPEYQGTPPDFRDPSAPDPALFAGVDDAVLTVARDGVERGRATGPLLPDVDLLTTSATAVAPGDLRVHLAVDDEFTSSPAPLKRLLVGALVAMLAVTAVLLLLLDRRVVRRSRRWRPGWPRLVDALVPAVIVFWAFVAPATDDDGYYAQMARNARVTGAVGNYYQLYNQNFTPFTWFYHVLGRWQELAGDAPVQQRVLAVAFGVVTWVLLRRFVAAAVPATAGPGVRALYPAVLAAVFLGWWLPQDMGVRPEGVVCVCGAAALLAVLVAGTRRRLAVAWLAFAVAGLGFAVHPTGFTLLAPLVAGLPLLWRAVAVPGARLVTALRALAVASGGMVAPLAAFADAGLRDFLRGQTIFLSIQAQDDWTNEIARYAFLLGGGAMGNYAKRIAVLLCLVSLVWFVALAAAARARRVALPTPLWLAGSTTALAFAALWITPSKWGHHFGALAGVGSAFLALFLVAAVPLLRVVLDGRRLPYGVIAAAATSSVMAIALSFHGPNVWPYAWLDGIRRPEYAPAVKGVLLGAPWLWLLVFGLVVAVLWAFGRVVGSPVLRNGDARLAAGAAVPAVAVLALLASSAYTVGTFGLAAAWGVPRSSVWAQSLADPTAERCAAAGATEVLDPFTATPLAVADGLAAPPAATGFVPNAGWYPGNQPQGVAARQVWGSLVASRPGGSVDQTVGEITTPWYTLPPDAGRDGAAATVLVAGSLVEGNSLTVEYGWRTGNVLVPLGTEKLEDTARDTSWRTLALTPPAGTAVLRLVGVDASGGTGGWLAFSAPVAARPVLLSTFLPRAAPVALAWPLAFGWPCQRQPGIVDGITEPPAFAVLWGSKGNLSGFWDGAWQPFRGGAFGQVPRSQSVLQLATVAPVDPYVQVFVFGSDLGRDRYTVTEHHRTVGGASTVVARDLGG